MGITDWDQWMKEHHIYIPTTDEIKKVAERNSKKVEVLRKSYEGLEKSLESYRKKVASHE